MKRTVLLLLVLCCLLILLKVVSLNGNKGNDLHIVSNDGRLLSCNNYDDSRFKTSLEVSKQISLPTDKVYGGIVNHHLTADVLIAEFFKSISIIQPDIVILVGPNHSGLGVNTVHTSSWNWNTPFGILQVNSELTDYLINNNLAGNNFELMENEHSISSLVPYIKYFMPNTEVVPIILSSSVEKNDAVELGKIIYDKVKEKNYLVISSVDFSHYLTLEEADKKDSITKEVLINRDFNRLNHMNNDYLDSPASIILLLTIMNEAGANNQIILDHSNSARILSGSLDSTTSYFVVAYY